MAVERRGIGGWAAGRLAPRPRADLALRLVALLCIAVGVALVASFAYGMIDGVQQSRSQTASWSRQLALTPPPAVPA